MNKWMQNFRDQILINHWNLLRVKTLNLQSDIKKKTGTKCFFKWYIIQKDIEKVDNNYKGKCWKCQDIDRAFYSMW